MWESILSIALDTGFIATLFTGLLVYVLRDTKRRECKYCEIIEELHENLHVVREIREDVADIKKKVERQNGEE